MPPTRTKRLPRGDDVVNESSMEDRHNFYTRLGTKLLAGSKVTPRVLEMLRDDRNHAEEQDDIEGALLINQRPQSDTDDKHPREDHEAESTPAMPLSRTEANKVLVPSSPGPSKAKKQRHAKSPVESEANSDSPSSRQQAGFPAASRSIQSARWTGIDMTPPTKSCGRPPLPTDGLSLHEFVRWLGRKASKRLIEHVLALDNEDMDYQEFGFKLSNQFLKGDYIVPGTRVVSRPFTKGLMIFEATVRADSTKIQDTDTDTWLDNYFEV